MQRQRRPGAVADRVVDLGHGRDAVVDQPERLAPQRLEQPVGDEAVDLRAHDAAGACRPRGRSRRRARASRAPVALAAAHLDERQQVDGVERMPDDEPLRPRPCRACSSRRQQPRGRRARSRVRPARPGSRARSSVALQLEPLGRALLHERRRPRRPPRPSRRSVSVPSAGSGAQRQPRERAPRVREHLADLARRLGIGVVARARRRRSAAKRAAQPPPITPPPSSPTSGSSATCCVSARRSRTSAGPRMRTFIASRIDDGALDELAVRREHAARRGRGCPRARRARCRPTSAASATNGSCMRPIENAEKTAPGGQPRDHREQRREVVGRAVGDAHAELDQRRVVDQPVADQLVRRARRWPVSNTSSSGRTPSSRTLRGHRAQHRGRVDHDVVAAGGEVHRAAVERADLGPQLGDVREPLVGARPCRCRPRRGGSGACSPAEHEVAAHAGGQVEHRRRRRRARTRSTTSRYSAVSRDAAPGRGIADVDVRDRRAGARRLDRRVGDLLRRHRHAVAARRRCRPAPVTAHVMKTSQFTRPARPRARAPPRARRVRQQLARCTRRSGDAKTWSPAPARRSCPGSCTATRSAIVRISARLCVTNSSLEADLARAARRAARRSRPAPRRRAPR